MIIGDFYVKQLAQDISKIKDVLVLQAQRELDFQTKSKYTDMEIVRIDATTSANLSTDKVTGKFTTPKRRIIAYVLSTSVAGADVYINLGKIPTTRDRIPLHTGGSWQFDDIPFRECYAITSSGTAEVYFVGYR